MCAEINTNVGGLGAQGAGAGAVSGSEVVQPQTGAQSPLSVSSIKESELEAAEMAIVAGVPILLPPSDFFTFLAAKISITESDIVSQICDNMVKSAQEMAERSKEEYLKKRQERVDDDKGGPKSASEYVAFLMTLSSRERDKEVSGPTEIAYNAAIQNWMITPLDAATNSGNFPSTAFVAGALVSSIGAMRSSIGADSSITGINLSSSPVADALLAGGPSSGLPGDYQAAAAMLAALLFNGAVNKANAETLQNAGGKSPQQLQSDFAINYAKQTLAIVTQHIEGEGTAASQNGLIRLMLATVALNLAYRAGYGGMSGIDLQALLNNPEAIAKFQNVPDDFKTLLRSLVDVANAYLNQLGPQARQEVLGRLSKYVDRKETAESMMQTTTLLSSLLQDVRPIGSV